MYRFERSIGSAVEEEWDEWGPVPAAVAIPEIQ
jgi:hypothetical protein